MADSFNRDSASFRRKDLAAKAIIVGAIVLAAMAALLCRLVWLQVVHYKYYKARSEENSSRTVFLRAPRGIIYDRNGNLLAANKQSLSLVVIPSQLEDIWALTKRLSSIIDLPAKDVYERLESAKQSNSVLPVVIERDLDLSVVGRLIEQQLFLPGVDIIPDISRTYPHGEIVSHVLGYTREISPEQLKQSPHRKMGDIVGQDGIERTYDEQLRGLDGEQRIKVNALGQSFSRETAKPEVAKEPTAGQPIVLSIDLDLQRAAYNALAGKKGAVVACDPRTGEILALASRPSFDNNVFTRRITPEILKEIYTADHPLYNRALSGFPPGSIWKPITLLAALDKKAVNPDTKLRVSGGISLGGFFFGDWTGAGGLYDLVKCLQWSRDSAFYQMGLKLSPEDIKEWAVKFGAGRPTGVELPQERTGLVPDSAWKWRALKDKWYPGNTLHMTIGQSYVLMTPIQAARCYAGLGMSGKVPNLHLVKKIGDRLLPSPPAEDANVEPEYMKLVRKGLWAVCHGGTGGRGSLPYVSVSGKTGSAEAPPAGSKTHAWFCCYAPSDDPQIAVCAFSEHGGHGGSGAAPMARAVLEKYFSTRGYKADNPAKPKAKSARKRR